MSRKFHDKILYFSQDATLGVDVRAHLVNLCMICNKTSRGLQRSRPADLDNATSPSY